MNPTDSLLADALTAGAATGRLPAVRPTADADEARRVAGQFEAIFLTEMFDAMYAGIPTDGAFDGGPAENIYRSMLNEQYAHAVTENGGIGIADAVMSKILKLQEVE